MRLAFKEIEHLILYRTQCKFRVENLASCWSRFEIVFHPIAPRHFRKMSLSLFRVTCVTLRNRQRSDAMAQLRHALSAWNTGCDHDTGSGAPSQPTRSRETISPAVTIVPRFLCCFVDEVLRGIYISRALTARRRRWVRTRATGGLQSAFLQRWHPAIAQRLCHVSPPDNQRAFEIGQSAGYPQNSVIAAR